MGVKAVLGILVPALALAQFTQQGAKLVGNGHNTIATGSCGNTTGISFGQGSNVDISADGNTLVTGANSDGPPDLGAAWIFTRSNGAWTQQGGKLVGTNQQGHGGQATVAISGDGNTMALANNNDNGGIGAVWFFTRSNGVWNQQGQKVVGSGATAASGPSCTAGQFNLCPGAAGQGYSVALSYDGNTAIVGGPNDYNNGLFFAGAAWIFTRSNGVWSQQGSKLVGSGVEPSFNGSDGASQGSIVAISADGNTAVIGGPTDGATLHGAAWAFTRSNGVWTQQGGKLVGTGATGPAGAGQGQVAISADGNTIASGGSGDNSGMGAVWIFTRSNGAWTQQGNKLVVTGAAGATVTANNGSATYGPRASDPRLSRDGNTMVVGSFNDNNFTGAFWVFKRSNGIWNQQGNKMVGTGAVGPASEGVISISEDASTIVAGGPGDNTCIGATWVWAQPTPVPAPQSVTLTAGGGTTQTITAVFADTGGWENLGVVDILIRDVLDGRQACYVAFTPNPSAPNSGSVLLVDDGGDAGGPYSGMVIPGTQTVSNSQCTIMGTGAQVMTSGNSVTLTLPITFTPAFAGNKVVYASAQDTAVNSGWSALATVSVAGPPVSGPTVTGVSPVQTAGFTAADTFTFADTNGYQDIAVANVLINGSIDGRHACFLALQPLSATQVSVLLVDDAGDAGGPFSGMVIPGNGSVSNSQCSITGAGSVVNNAGNTMKVTLPITFQPGFAGNQVVYAAARSNTANSGWQAAGTAAVH